MEGEPPAERGKFDSARDEALYLMAAEGWSNASSGDVDGPTGWFARVSNYDREMTELLDIFDSDLQTLGVQPSQILGHFFLIEDSFGQVHVTEYRTETELLETFEQFETVYQAWRGN